MSMHLWKPEMIYFMNEAVHQNLYFQQLAERIKPYCPEGAYICDAGCGLGDLSLELARHVGFVDAIDREPRVIDVLNKKLKDNNVNNVNTVVSRIEDIERPRHYETMIFCLSEPIETAVELSRRHGADTVIIINKTKHLHRRYSRTYRFGTFFQDVDSPDYMYVQTETGSTYVGETFSLDLGQPFRSLGEAKVFFEIYRDDLFSGEKDFSAFESKLVSNNSEIQPYFFPMRRELCMFVLKTPELISRRYFSHDNIVEEFIDFHTSNRTPDYVDCKIVRT